MALTSLFVMNFEQDHSLKIITSLQRIYLSFFFEGGLNISSPPSQPPTTENSTIQSYVQAYIQTFVGGYTVACNVTVINWQAIVLMFE